MLNIRERHITMALPSARLPYRKHLLTLSRGSTGRLKAEIESWSAGELDPSRVEVGPLHKLARALGERYNCNGQQMAQTLTQLNCSAWLIAEVEEDMKLEADIPAELETI